MKRCHELISPRVGWRQERQSHRHGLQDLLDDMSCVSLTVVAPLHNPAKKGQNTHSENTHSHSEDTLRDGLRVIR